MVLGLGLGILVLGLLSTGRWARGTAARAAASFEGVDSGAAEGARHAVPATLSQRVPLLFGPGQSGRGAGWDADGAGQLRRDVARFRR